MVIYYTTINDLVAAAYTAMAAVVNAKKAVVKAYELLNDTTNPNALSDDVQHFTSIDQPWEYIQAAAMEMNNVNNNMMDAARLVEEEVNIVGAAEEGEVGGGGGGW